MLAGGHVTQKLIMFEVECGWMQQCAVFGLAFFVAYPATNNGIATLLLNRDNLTLILRFSSINCTPLQTSITAWMTSPVPVVYASASNDFVVRLFILI